MFDFTFSDMFWLVLAVVLIVLVIGWFLPVDSADAVYANITVINSV